MPAAARREQILTAALSCFGEKGYHASTMDDLVRASGLSKGSLYWHFDSKLAVFLALFDRFAEDLLAGWDASQRPDTDVRTWMQEGLAGVIEIIGGEAELAGVWTEFLVLPEGRERVAGIYRVSRERIEGVVSEGIARGELRRLDVPAAAATLLAAIEGLALQSMVDPDFDLAPHLDGIWDLLAGGMSA